MTELYIAAGFAFLMPIALLLIWKKKTGADTVVFVVGAACFTVFAMMLEPILHSVCLLIDSPVSRALNSNVLLYALYGGLAAGLFEETGRYIGFRFLLKRHRDKSDAIAYGIGHGGIEAVLTLGLTYAVYIAAANGLRFGVAEADAEMAAAIATVTPALAYTAIFERCSAMLLHLGLSVVVFTAVKEKKLWLYPLAIVLHACGDLSVALYQSGAASILAVEGIIFVYSVLVFAYGIYLYKKLK